MKLYDLVSGISIYIDGEESNIIDYIKENGSLPIEKLDERGEKLLFLMEKRDLVKQEKIDGILVYVLPTDNSWRN